MAEAKQEQAGASRLRELAAVALAEMRSARRLARTWLFGALALILGLLSYVYYSVLHGIGSGFSGSLGLMNPRFLMSAIGAFLIWLFLVAMIFLAFDVRARDTRERMAEVLDARPVDNLTMLTGRVLGLVVVVWVPLLLMALAMQGLGGLALALELPMGEMIEPRSLLAFLLVDAPVNLALWAALVALLAVVLRNRLAVVLAALALCGLQLYGLYQTPAYLAPALAGFAAFSQLASDVLPHFASAADLVQRGCLLLAAAGLIVLAAALHPRPDRSDRALRLGMGAGLLVLAIGGIGGLVWRADAAMALRAAWVAHHEAHREAPVATLDHVAGEVTIDAGASLELALDYTVAPPPGASTLHFAFNPGMAVRELRVAGEAASFEHVHGLLQVEIPPAAGGRTKLQLSVAASGVPDPAFAYLDSAIDLASANASQGNALSLLGIDASVFDARYVALMPAAYWMPLPGVAVGGEQADRRGSDFFTMDLQVRTPEEWLTAGPGRREGANGEYRFRPAAPVPAVGILASRFERRATEVADVELELLMSPQHMRNVAVFEDLAEPLAERLREMLAYAAEHEFAYPYKTLTAVEIPARLRVFGGDWRMDSVQALPGMVLLREYGFPTSRFELAFERLDDMEDGEQQDRARVWTLQSFFHNDITGGDPLHGAARNFVGFQTSASGAGAVALDFVVHDLTVQLLTGARRGFFSAHMLGSQQELQSLIMGSIFSFASGQSASIAGSAYMAATRKPSVWDTALAASLADLQPRADAKRALEVLWLKGPEIAQAILDGIGRERAGALLAELRRRHRGGNYTLADFHAAAEAVGADLNTLLGDWLHDAALPGYLVSPVRVARLPDDDVGAPRYQIAVDVRNDEPVPGLLRLSYAEETEAGFLFDSSEPTRVPANSAVELGMVAKAVPKRLSLASYLSLNRRPLQLPLPEVKDETVDAEPFTGARPSDWRPPEDPAIVVDDLDSGFSVQDNTEDGGLAGGMPWGTPDADIDQGLPVYGPFSPGFRWSRQEAENGWGKYRRTLARVAQGDGRAKAVFTVALPTAGRWRLEYHIPALRATSVQIGPGGVRSRGSYQPLAGQGTYDLRLHAAGEERELEFDASAGSPGWNRIGDYDLPAGEVRLTVSNDTSGKTVLADAIRWVPLTQ